MGRFKTELEDLKRDRRSWNIVIPILVQSGS